MKSKRRQVNYRLDPKTILVLKFLSDALGVTKTEIIETSVLEFYERSGLDLKIKVDIDWSKVVESKE